MACPLANGNYATVRERQGKLYLFVKTVERSMTPAKCWEATLLDDNYDNALAKIDQKLEFWNGFIIHKCKQRLTKLTEMLRRKRRLKLSNAPELVTIKQKAQRRDLSRMEKAEKVARVDTKIEQELLDRLKIGTYGDLYDDLFNLNPTAMNRYLEEQNKPQEEMESDEESIELEVNLLGK